MQNVVTTESAAKVALKLSEALEALAQSNDPVLTNDMVRDLAHVVKWVATLAEAYSATI